MPPRDPYDLARFVAAQGPVIERVYAELRAGRKTSHWMWFVFPQILGLGDSRMSLTFAIFSLAEAEAYLHHPVLGQRLRLCTRLVIDIEGSEISEVFAYPDDRKFHASMTLFSRAGHDGTVFREALQKYFGGRLDQATLDRL